MDLKATFLSALLCAFTAIAAQAQDQPMFHSTDTLAPRDQWGLLHSGKTLYSTDFAPRYHWRPLYWLEGGRDLINQPAYVGALQRDLIRLGYYCGPIDGIFTEDLSIAIAQMQKNYSMRVTGTLTVPVRRALHLPLRFRKLSNVSASIIRLFSPEQI